MKPKNIKVLLAEPSFTNDYESYIGMIKNGIAVPVEIIRNPFGRRVQPDELPELVKGCIAVVAGLEKYDSEMLNRLEMLHCISRVGVGLDNIDLVAAKQKGIQIFSTPDAPSRAVAEMALGLAINLMRNISFLSGNVKAGKWEKITGKQIFDSNVGIVGLGRIGKISAELFKKTGANVLGYDPFVDETCVGKAMIEMVSLERLFSESDIVILHASVTGETKNLINRHTLGSMRKDAYLINLSRGDIVNENDLLEALRNKTIAGAALDVFCQEPYEGPFRELDNVILTPHVGSQTTQARRAMKTEAVQNMINFLKETTDEH